jgi:hypothetical protein
MILRSSLAAWSVIKVTSHKEGGNQGRTENQTFTWHTVTVMAKYGVEKIVGQFASVR